MPHYRLLDRLASSRHKAERSREHAELKTLALDINSCNNYMNKDPESPLNVAGSLIRSADAAALVSDYQFAGRNYRLAIWLLGGMERTVLRGEREEADPYKVFLPQIREMAETARTKLAQLKPEQQPGQLELLVALSF